MAYRWVDHTAELELHLDCAAEDEVFADALRAFAELVGDEGEHEAARYDVAITAPDRPALLARWLDELVFQAETAGLVPDGVDDLRLEGQGLRARVRGHRAHPRHIVKGVTYHRLAFDRAGDRYHATIVLDV